MDEFARQFKEARDFLIRTIPGKIETYLTNDWDPFTRYSLIRETKDIIIRELQELFPTIPSEQLPDIRFRIHEDIHEIEVGVQYYYHTQNGLTYLGTTELGSETFDFYVRKSYDPRFDYRLLARFGSKPDDYITGTKTAEAEYYLGQYTPLSCAYALALQDGFIG